MQGKDVILGILKTGDRTGYEINDILKNRLSYFYDGSYGMIYPTLKKLENDGFVEKKEIIQSGKPNKNVYSITGAGRKSFDKYFASTVVEDIYKSDFLMRLFFGEDMSTEQTKQLLEETIKHKKTQLQQLKENQQKWEKQRLPETQRISIRYGIAFYTSAIETLTRELKNLDSEA